MRSLILALFLLGCETGTEIDGTAEGCPETEIDLTVPQVLVYCSEGAGVMVIDTAQERCANVLLGSMCASMDCLFLDSETVNWMGSEAKVSCDAIRLDGHVVPRCDPPESVKVCSWLTE